MRRACKLIQSWYKMKMKYLYTLLIASFLGLPLAQAKPFVYYVDVCNFYDNEGKPYIEFYLDVAAASLSYQVGADGNFEGKGLVGLEITDMVKNEVVYQRSFELVNPGVRDTSAKKLDYGLMDVRRIGLEPGLYSFSGTLKDAGGAESKTYKFVKEIELEPAKETIAYLSDVEFIQSFSKAKVDMPYNKHGYAIVPLVNNGTFLDSDSLHFYLESYHANKEAADVMFVSTYVTLANSTSKLPGYQKVLRMEPQDLNIIQSSFQIDFLPSQTYYLNIELYNKEQKLIGSTAKRFFVSNSRVDAPMVGGSDLNYGDHFDLEEEDLDYYIHTLYYISTPTEVEFVKALNNLQDKQNYFLSFWEKRKENQDDSPAKPWKSYKSRVDHANKNFKAAHLEGWRTDRGRVMLTYGAPNEVERYPSSNTSHPYHIWRFNKLTTQANVQFVFVNLNEATSDWELIHSNRLGEPNNPRWQYDVVRNSPVNQTFDNNQLFDETDPW